MEYLGDVLCTKKQTDDMKMEFEKVIQERSTAYLKLDYEYEKQCTRSV